MAISVVLVPNIQTTVIVPSKQQSDLHYSELEEQRKNIM